MRPLRIGAAALNQLPLDWNGNRRRIAAALAEARAEGVGLLCLPELALTGYGCEDAFASPALLSRALDLLEDLLPETKGIAVNLGLPLQVRGLLYNANAMVCDGRLLGFACKRYLAGDGVHYEPRWFRAWPRGGRSTMQVRGNAVLVGDVVFELDGVRVGFEICEEAWVAQRPGADLAARGVDVVLNPSASHFAFGKHTVRERFVLEGSRAFSSAYAFANLLGNEAGRLIYDGDTLLAAGGSLLASAPRLRFHEVTVTHAVVDLDHLRLQRARTPSFQASPLEEPDDTLRVDFTWPPATLEPSRSAPCPGPPPDPETEKLEGFTRAIALALFDYLRKSWSRGWVVSLSGGADSAATATLCALSLHFAVEDLGLEGTKKRLSYIPGVDACTCARDLVGRLLSTVYQSTANSGAVTRDAAAAVADALGAAHRVWDVEAQVAGYRALLEEDQGRALTWETDDLALQNIQARTRSPGVWMLANLENKLLLSTSNRSEAAVGYATMDGDTSGGIAPIAGIDKAFLRAWLVDGDHRAPWPRADSPPADHQRPAAPAELRPADRGQTDEDDLMPYPVLDAIEGAAIRDKLDPIETFQVLQQQFPQADAATVQGWVRRFFRLWTRNQWKQSATPRASTWMTRTWTPRPGAAFPS